MKLIYNEIIVIFVKNVSQNATSTNITLLKIAK